MQSGSGVTGGLAGALPIWQSAVIARGYGKAKDLALGFVRGKRSR